MNKVRPYWMPRSKYFFQTLTPEFSEEYEWEQCWHGCDKVSILKPEHFGGGGGS